MAGCINGKLVMDDVGNAHVALSAKTSTVLQSVARVTSMQRIAGRLAQLAPDSFVFTQLCKRLLNVYTPVG